MGRRGPRPKPSALKLVRGERRPSRVNKEEPKPAPPSSLDPPKDLGPDALEHWKRHAAELVTLGVLASTDMASFAVLCRTWGDLQRYERLVVNEEPLLAIAKGFAGMVIKLRAQYRQLASDFGLTPSSRSGVKVKAAQPLDPFEAFVGGKKA